MWNGIPNPLQSESCWCAQRGYPACLWDLYSASASGSDMAHGLWTTDRGPLVEVTAGRSHWALFRAHLSSPPPWAWAFFFSTFPRSSFPCVLLLSIPATIPNFLPSRSLSTPLPFFFHPSVRLCLPTILRSTRSTRTTRNALQYDPKSLLTPQSRPLGLLPHSPPRAELLQPTCHGECWSAPAEGDSPDREGLVGWGGLSVSRAGPWREPSEGRGKRAERCGKPEQSQRGSLGWNGGGESDGG